MDTERTLEKALLKLLWQEDKHGQQRYHIAYAIAEVLTQQNIESLNLSETATVIKETKNHFH